MNPSRGECRIPECASRARFPRAVLQLGEAPSQAEGAETHRRGRHLRILSATEAIKTTAYQANPEYHAMLFKHHTRRKFVQPLVFFNPNMDPHLFVEGKTQAEAQRWRAT